jgi:DNA polymerase-1
LAKYKYKHPIMALLISHRELAKLVSTYVLPLKECAREGSLVHTSFNLTGTITGRLSSSNPNLQNIPKRTERGRTIREAFVSRFEGGKLVSADYNQIELRLVAHYSGDEVLTQAYINGEDIHTRTASEIFGLKDGEVSPEARRSAKAVNFGIIYGISPYGLGEQIGVSPSVAKEYIELYFKRFPRVKEYLDSSWKTAENSGGKVHTLFGRVRIIDEVFSENANMREFGKRAAMNFPLQGSAADIIKLAMIKVDAALREGKFRAKLVLQVHDELVVDAPPEEVAAIEKLLKETMESVASLKLPLVVEVGSSYHLT